ncbi:hypothetical protein CEXT_656781 [Caerostris extrusa]|uniref:Uncharacterized protein n=1 Tax=Caerostris extrusa TaxID=172846 RepID=A0AAV4TGZ6_CAEEX|nr:hypothetical protein CEXT_656781 [Caerostris extrusa]
MKFCKDVGWDNPRPSTSRISLAEWNAPNDPVRPERNTDWRRLRKRLVELEYMQGELSLTCDKCAETHRTGCGAVLECRGTELVHWVNVTVRDLGEIARMDPMDRGGPQK